MHVNSYHGKVLRFIGMTVLSGLVAASLAPASFAAPSDSQETNTETQVSATVLSYPGTNGPTRIHIITRRAQQTRSSLNRAASSA